jgi:hypothetical protein
VYAPKLDPFHHVFGPFSRRYTRTSVTPTSSEAVPVIVTGDVLFELTAGAVITV